MRLSEEKDGVISDPTWKKLMFGGEIWRIGDTYNDEKGAAALRALFATGLFKDVRIEVDGGVGLDTVAEVVRAGAEILVAGNAVFGSGDPKANAWALLEAARSASLQRV